MERDLNFCIRYYSTCRISSRTLLIPFNKPKVGPRTEDQVAAFEQLEAASIMTGTVIKIESDFVNAGRTETLETFNPILFDAVGISNPQVVTGCSILLYFTNKVYTCICNYVYIIMHSLHFKNTIVSRLCG